MTKFQPYCLLV